MFTGLIEELGTITNRTPDQLLISCKKGVDSPLLTNLAIGDSVSVDGVCLTVETILSEGFTATASPETLSKTTLGNRIQVAQYVNLETSLKVGGKIGGHFVTGHVDGLGYFREAISTKSSWEIYFGIPPKLEAQWQESIAPYLVSKGSVAVNGISLTVAECSANHDWFMVAVIPLSFAETNLACLQSGDLVNIESDILSKYVKRLISYKQESQESQPDISLSFLADHGYL